MDENQEAHMRDDPAESGALEPEGEGGRQAGVGRQQDPVESGALEDEQEGKGYGMDEGERDAAL
jgi:hypothetical protein